MYEINFFTVATGKYKDFILPYVTSALYHNRNSFAEIIVDSNNSSVHHDIQLLNTLYAGRFIIYEMSDKYTKYFKTNLWSSRMASLRFVTKPKIKAELTYIGDIDILFLDTDIAQQHLKYMSRTKLPYSNIKRKGQNRLGGLHCVKTKEYYSTIKNLASYEQYILRQKPEFLDEHLLYHIVNKYFGVPKSIWQENKYKSNCYFRPYHGLHCSLNTTKSLWWNHYYKDKFMNFYNSDTWTSVFAYVKPWYKKEINLIYNANLKELKC